MAAGRRVRFSAAAAATAAVGLLLGVCCQSRAGVTVSTSPDAPNFDPGASIISPVAGNVQTLMTVNQQAGPGVSQAQTFKTGASGFQLDKIVIYSGGKAGCTATMNLYPAPVGGEDTDGFVNTSFSTDLFNGGNGLTATINGSPGNQYITFDLTGADEITLNPATKYALEFDITGATGSQFSWMRSSAGQYPDGNLYQGASELNFNGTPPANGRGERDQVGGTPQRDAGFAIYAVPEPGSLSLFGIAAACGLIRRRRHR